MRHRVEAMVRRGGGSYYKMNFISNHNDVQVHMKAIQGEGYEVLSVKAEPDDQQVFVDDNQGNMSTVNGVLVESEDVVVDDFVPEGGEDEEPVTFSDLISDEIERIEEGDNDNGPS